ncbi:MAG: glycoside hydrolase family 3 protein [Candidatus Sumerlaeaceae bacterium]
MSYPRTYMIQTLITRMRLAVVLTMSAGTAVSQSNPGCDIGQETAFTEPVPAELVAYPKTITLQSVTSGPALRAPNYAWVASTRAQMTLDEKIGQMLMPGYSSGSANGNVSTYKVGGFIFQGNGNTASAILAATNSLQGITSVPLMFSVDCEAGLGARVVDATRFPLNMGCAAAHNTALAQQQGGVTARECRSVGIQIGFGPVLDVNTEPINPIIGIRSYGDKPSLVSQMAGAYVAGANAEGLLVTYKHFPGHGATIGDSHNQFQVVDIPNSELQSVHVAPYATLIGQGTGDLVMSAHVWYPQLDPLNANGDALPATLSINAIKGILHDQLQFKGTMISDSFAMAGLMEITNTYDGVTSGVLSGLDIILTPNSMANAFNGLKDAVIANKIPLSRIDDAVSRILVLKSRAGMPETTTVSATAMPTIMGHADNMAVATDIGKRAIVKARVQSVDVPLTSSQSVLIFNLASRTGGIFYTGSYGSSYFNSALQSYIPGAVTQIVSNGTLSTTTINNFVTQAQGYNRVVVTSHEWTPANTASQITLVSQLLQNNIRFIYCDFGSPYQISQWSNLKNFFCGFSTLPATQQEMARVLVGLSSTQGDWPVTIAGVAETTGVGDWAMY